MPTYWEFKLFAFVSLILAIWLGLRYGLLWWDRRKAKREGFYGYPYIEARPNKRMVRL